MVTLHDHVLPRQSLPLLLGPPGRLSTAVSAVSRANIVCDVPHSDATCPSDEHYCSTRQMVKFLGCNSNWQFSITSAAAPQG